MHPHRLPEIAAIIGLTCPVERFYPSSKCMAKTAYFQRVCKCSLRVDFPL